MKKKIFSNLKNGQVIMIAIACILISEILLYMVINYKMNESKKNDSIIESGEYAKLFVDDSDAMVYQYAKSTKYTYEEAFDTIEKINKLFDINIKTLRKADVTDNDLNEADSSLIYETWNDTNELVVIKNGDIVKAYSIGESAPMDNLEDYICEMLFNSKTVSIKKLSSMLNTMSLDDYIAKVKKGENFYLLFGNDINESIFSIYTFDKSNLDFYYLDYTDISNEGIQKLVNTNEKFSTLSDEYNTMAYVVDANNIELFNTFSTYTIYASLEEIKEDITKISKTSLLEYKLMRVIDILGPLSNNSISNFATISDNKLKAKMVLDKTDFIDEVSISDDDGNTYVTKELFDAKTKELFGSLVTIDISNIGQIQAGDSCAFWDYDESHKKFERGDAGCGGDDGKFREIVTSTFRETTNDYTIETKEAFVMLYKGKVYADSQCKVLIGTIDLLETVDEEAYLRTLVDKLYTYKYTFTKTPTGYYLKSFEIVK